MLDDKQLEQIVNDLKKTDKSYSEIADEYGTSKVSVRYWAERLKKLGNDIPERKRGRRPRTI